MNNDNIHSITVSSWMASKNGLSEQQPPHPEDTSESTSPFDATSKKREKRQWHPKQQAPRETWARQGCTLSDLQHYVTSTQTYIHPWTMANGLDDVSQKWSRWPRHQSLAMHHDFWSRLAAAFEVAFFIRLSPKEQACPCPHTGARWWKKRPQCNRPSYSANYQNDQCTALDLFLDLCYCFDLMVEACHSMAMVWPMITYIFMPKLTSSWSTSYDTNMVFSMSSTPSNWNHGMVLVKGLLMPPYDISYFLTCSLMRIMTRCNHGQSLTQH